MAYYDNYVNNVLANGNNTSDQFSNYTQQWYDLTFKNSPNYISNATLNNVAVDIRAESIRESKNQKPSDEFKKVLFRDLSLEIKYGDMLNFWDKTWMIVDKKVSSPASNTCTVEHCNQPLKTILSNGKLINYPCIVEGVGRNDLNVEDLNNVQTQKTQLIMVVQNNEDTIQIKPSWRLIFGTNVYKILNYDDATVNGLISFKIISDGERVGLDNWITGIADNSVQPAPTPTGTIQINGSATLKVNTQQTYTVQYDNGTAVSGTYTWTISDTSKVTIVSQTGTTITIKGLFYGQVKLTATNTSDSSKTYSKIISVQNGI
jgi:hypothetical protein